MTPYYADEQVTLWLGDSLDVLRTLPAGSVNCCVTSPPYYGLRDYGQPGQYGLEPSLAEYVETMRAVFAEVRRVLADDGTLWLNIGDSWANDAKWGGASGGKHVTALHGQTGIGRGRKETGLPPKSLMGMPWRLALALQGDGWVLRSDVIWRKPNAMPESVQDRPAATHEHVFMLAARPRYWFDLDPIREPLTYPDAANGRRPIGGTTKADGGGRSARYRPTSGAYSMATPPGHRGPKNGGPGPHHDEANPKGRNPGDVWDINTQPFPEAHFAVMPPALAKRCILAGCKPGGTVLDPFAGSGTTGMVAAQHGRRFVGIDLSREYLDLALRTRLAQTAIVDDLAGEMAS